MQDEEYQNYYNKMIEAFIDKPEKTLWYQDAFSKFNLNGVDTMKWHWSWWALGGGAGFLLYRKQYLAAFFLFFASFILGMIPLISIIIMILSGGFSTFFIYKGFKKRLVEIEQNIEDEEQRIEVMREIGGYHPWVIWVYGILTTLFLVFGLSLTFLALNYPS